VYTVFDKSFSGMQPG